jgi:CRP-like cAMP-binding protein
MTTVHRLQNNLLRTMADDDFAALEPSFTLVDLAKRDELALPESRVKFSWFPLGGIISVVASTESGIQAEVGIVGREGMCSVATLHGVDFEMMHIFCQMPGRALRIPATTLRAILIARPTLLTHLLGYAQNFMLQIASSALAYATQTIEARLARWLLMSLDRLEANDVTMTHKALALMLGVRRAGVTVAIQALEAKGALIGRRAALTVVNRTILAEIAGDAYGTAERAYQRVLGVSIKSPARADAIAGMHSDGVASPE